VLRGHGQYLGSPARVAVPVKAAVHDVSGSSDLTLLIRHVLHCLLYGAFERCCRAIKQAVIM
jgi:hypothetical protein